MVESVFLIVVGALIIAALWFVTYGRRATKQDAYAELAARTESTLSDVLEQLAELNRRTAEVERILKDAE